MKIMKCAEAFSLLTPQSKSVYLTEEGYRGFQSEQVKEAAVRPWKSKNGKISRIHLVLF